MTPQSIPDLQIKGQLEALLHLGDLASPLHHGPAYEHHEVFLTDLPRAA